MIGKLPKFLEGKPLPKGYYETPNPYEDQPLSEYNLRAMLSYAETSGKNVNDLSYEEAEKFRVFKRDVV